MLLNSVREGRYRSIFYQSHTRVLNSLPEDQNKSTFNYRHTREKKQLDQGWGCGSVGTASPTQVRFPGAVRDFSPRVNFQCRLSYVCLCTPPCAIACINICMHVKDPVVHVSVRWIMKTLKHPTCTVHRLGSATLSQLAFSEEGNPNFPREKILSGQCSCKK